MISEIYVIYVQLFQLMAPLSVDFFFFTVSVSRIQIDLYPIST